MQYDKALTPIFSHSSHHYFRVFFSCTRAKSACDEITGQHTLLLYCVECGSFCTSTAKRCTCSSTLTIAGPLYDGKLWDESLTQKMQRDAVGLSKPLLDSILDESQIPTLGFYDTHALCKKHHIPVPSMQRIFTALHTTGHLASRTHFNEYAIKTTLPFEKFIEILIQSHDADR